jgi:hypothetical protein
MSFPASRSAAKSASTSMAAMLASARWGVLQGPWSVSARQLDRTLQQARGGKAASMLSADCSCAEGPLIQTRVCLQHPRDNSGRPTGCRASLACAAVVRFACWQCCWCCWHCRPQLLVHMAPAAAPAAAPRRAAAQQQRRVQTRCVLLLSLLASLPRAAHARAQHAHHDTHLTFWTGMA